ncbi:unnamed protein product [Nezara viridula]|uniref:Uncharacterized protein n=1 Tax=Nezara viridula TaxID=85310 RepID=A0A9P0H547_NEZVI|nr:unnamed protein product [Nezara viridula]
MPFRPDCLTFFFKELWCRSQDDNCLLLNSILQVCERTSFVSSLTPPTTVILLEDERFRYIIPRGAKPAAPPAGTTSPYKVIEFRPFCFYSTPGGTSSLFIVFPVRTSRSRFAFPAYLPYPDLRSPPSPVPRGIQLSTILSS